MNPSPDVATAESLSDFPTSEELFGPHPKIEGPPLPSAWTDSGSIAGEIVDRETTRLLINHLLYDPPIRDPEIQNYASQRQLSFDAAEIEIRRARHA
jgi:hypothetical protein